MPAFAAIVTESESPTACFFGFCQMPESACVELHGGRSVGILGGPGSRCLGHGCRRGGRSRSRGRASGRDGPGEGTGCRLRWWRSSCCVRALEASFGEMRVKPDSEVLEVEVSLGLANWGNFIFEFFFEVEVKLITKGLIIPMHILFLGLE